MLQEASVSSLALYEALTCKYLTMVEVTGSDNDLAYNSTELKIAVIYVQCFYDNKFLLSQL